MPDVQAGARRNDVHSHRGAPPLPEYESRRGRTEKRRFYRLGETIMGLDEVTKTRPTNWVGRRSSSPQVPVDLRVLGVELDQDNRYHLRRKLGMKLGKCATSIERISVRVEDVNGPRGGVDQVCRINVGLIGLPPVVVEGRSASLEGAIGAALTGVERAVRRTVQRRRMKPIRGRNSRRTSGSDVPSAAE